MFSRYMCERSSGSRFPGLDLLLTLAQPLDTQARSRILTLWFFSALSCVRPLHTPPPLLSPDLQLRTGDMSCDRSTCSALRACLDSLFCLSVQLGAVGLLAWTFAAADSRYKHLSPICRFKMGLATSCADAVLDQLGLQLRHAARRVGISPVLETYLRSLHHRRS